MPRAVVYLLDSSVCVTVPRQGGDVRRLPPPGRCLVSQITVAELWTGIEKGDHRAVRAVRLEVFSLALPVSTLTKPPPALTARFARRWKTRSNDRPARSVHCGARPQRRRDGAHRQFRRVQPRPRPEGIALGVARPPCAAHPVLPSLAIGNFEAFVRLAPLFRRCCGRGQELLLFRWSRRRGTARRPLLFISGSEWRGEVRERRQWWKACESGCHPGLWN